MPRPPVSGNYFDLLQQSEWLGTKRHLQARVLAGIHSGFQWALWHNAGSRDAFADFSFWATALASWTRFALCACPGRRSARIRRKRLSRKLHNHYSNFRHGVRGRSRGWNRYKGFAVRIDSPHPDRLPHDALSFQYAEPTARVRRNCFPILNQISFLTSRTASNPQLSRSFATLINDLRREQSRRSTQRIRGCSEDSPAARRFFFSFFSARDTEQYFKTSRMTGLEETGRSPHETITTEPFPGAAARADSGIRID